MHFSLTASLFCSTENTWEPHENLDCPDLIAEFEQKRKKEMQLRKQQQKKKVDRGKGSSSSQLLTESEIKKECNPEFPSSDDRTIPMQKLRKEMEVLVCVVLSSNAVFIEYFFTHTYTIVYFRKAPELMRSSVILNRIK